MENKNIPLLFKLDDSLGSLEKEIMAVIWREKKTTVREVLESLRKRRVIAYTTVMTVMHNLYKKGFLKRHKVEKYYRYDPQVFEKDLVSQSISQALSLMISKYGRSKVYLTLVSFNVKIFPQIGSVIAYRTPAVYGLTLTLLIVVFVFSTWDLRQNLQFFGTFDYLKYTLAEPELLIGQFFLLLVAFLESFPIINLLTTLISFALVIVLVRKLSQLFFLKTPLSRSFRGTV